MTSDLDVAKKWREMLYGRFVDPAVVPNHVCPACQHNAFNAYVSPLGLVTLWCALCGEEAGVVVPKTGDSSDH